MWFEILIRVRWPDISSFGRAGPGSTRVATAGGLLVGVAVLASDGPGGHRDTCQSLTPD